MGSTRDKLLAALVAGEPLSSREIRGVTGLTGAQVWNGLSRAWEGGYVLRTVEPIYEVEKAHRGRKGRPTHIRPYHLYVLAPPDKDSLTIEGRRFEGYSGVNSDPRVRGGESQAARVIRYLREHRGEAFFSVEVAEALSGEGVKQGSVMSSVRRAERKGLVYVRGYKGHDRQSPFRRGYLLTWLWDELPREQAIREALERTDERLGGLDDMTPTLLRVRRIRDIVLEHSLLRKLVSPVYLRDALGEAEHLVKHALKRVLELYPDILEVKLFDAYRYYHHVGLSGVELDAAVEQEKNYVRLAKGAFNRVGHNWEAVADWFIDNSTRGASFWTQQHRDGMDSKRINLFLVKGVGGRRRVAEVDRVWEVTPGPFAPTITYVLSCKWGLVRKSHVDDFLEVLRWSKEFGVDTPDGRELKQGVVGVFAASSFKRDDTVRLKDETVITLAQYASRRNLQIITGADFNGRLRERGCQKEVTVQRVCRYACDEDEVRESLSKIWANPDEARNVLTSLRRANRELFEFEKQLQET